MRWSILFLFLTFLPVAAAQEWEYLDSGVTNDLNAISCPDERTCYVAGGAPYIGGPGIILKSDDGGDSWEQEPIPTTEPMRGINCVDTETCFAAGGLIIKRISGEWIIADDRDQTLWDIDATSSTHAVAVGNLGTTLRTTDGTGWSGYTPPRTGPFEETLSTIRFINSLEGWAGGGAGTFKYTDDGGASWVDRNSGQSLGLADIFSFDGNPIWTCGSFTYIMKTIDGGLEWDQYEFPPMGGCGAIEFANDTFGWLLGNGAIEYSHDGGMTWEVQEGLDRLVFFRDIECFGPDLCYAIGDDGVIIRYGEPEAASAEVVEPPQEEVVEEEPEEERGELRAVYNDSPVFTASPQCPAFLDDCEAGYNPIPEYGSNGCIVDYTCVEGSFLASLGQLGINLNNQQLQDYLNSVPGFLQNIPGVGGKEDINVYITKSDGSQTVLGIVIRDKRIKKITLSELDKPNFRVETTEQTLSKILNSEGPANEALTSLNNKEISIHAEKLGGKIKLAVAKIFLKFKK